MLSSKLCAVGILTATAVALTGLSPQQRPHSPVTETPVNLPEQDRPAAGARDAGEPDAQAGDARFTLDLGGVQFDPVAGGPDLPEGWNVVRRDVPDMHLVQFSGPIQGRWIDQLEGAGVKVMQYVHPFTYIVWGRADVVEAARGGVEGVRWVGEFAPAYRVLPRFRGLPADDIDVHFMVYRGADVKDIVQQITALGAANTGREVIDNVFEVLGFRMSGAMFQAAASIPGVYSIQPVPTDGGLRGEMTNMINLVNTNQIVAPGYAAWLSSMGVNGNGVIIANVDGGVNENHPDLAGRFLPCVGTSCGTASTQSTHGTHTAGTMAATGASGTMANGGFLRAQGVAPGANMIEQLYSPTYTTAGGMLMLMTISQRNGASLSGNSWGPSGSPLGYDNNTRQCDVGVRDADPAAPGNQPLSFVLSFMNGSGGTSTQGTPDEGKNIFTIGSTKGQSSGSGTQILQINDLSANTAHGPALDGRKIPHMVAPGCYVDSSTTATGYGLNCGTSMASPHVSGAVALFIQKYRTLPNYTVDPSPAMIKAAFLGNATDLAGHLDADNGVLGHPFDNKQGWGRMNLPAVINPPANSTRYFDNPQLLNNTGDEWVTTVSPLNPNEPMRIMLVWTDAPGHGLGGSTPAWVNDLDLIVESGAGTYRGNNFGGNGFSVTGGVADNRNNTEGVFIGPLPPSSVTIRVRATNIAGDGVPNVGDATDQDFALVVYNGAVEPGFAMQVTPAEHVICAPDIPQYTIQVDQILGFTDPVTLSAAGAPAGASVSFSPNPVSVPGTATMTINNTAAATPGDHDIVITGTAGKVVRDSAVSLVLTTAVPGDITLTSPANDATNVSPTPALAWAAASQASQYQIEISTSSGFGTIAYSGVSNTNSHAVTTALNPDTIYYWRVRGQNACGNGSYSEPFSFRTLDVPPILLVDDDDNSPNVASYYTAALDAIVGPGNYDVWNTNNTDNEPTAVQLAPYRIVIWFTGDEFGGACGPGAAAETALAAWLDTGRKGLFISSQDYRYDRGLTTFMTGRLGVSAITNDNGLTVMTGANVFAGYGPYSLTFPPGMSDYTDRVTPGNGGMLAFSDQGPSPTSTSKDAGTYRTVFFTYPFEAIATAPLRQTVMQKVLDWFDELVPPCPGDTNGSGAVDVDDLSAVINDWGPCPAPCGADINEDGFVDVDDLIAVILGWGECP